MLRTCSLAITLFLFARAIAPAQAVTDTPSQQASTKRSLPKRPEISPSLSRVTRP